MGEGVAEDARDGVEGVGVGREQDEGQPLEGGLCECAENRRGDLCAPGGRIVATRWRYQPKSVNPTT